MNVQEVSLDISLKRNISPEVYIGQEDSNATTLVASIFDGATPFNLGSYTVRFCMRLPDGVHYYSVAGTTSGNVATFDIDETYAGAVHGTTDVAYVEISDGNDVIASTSRMCVIVLRGAQAGATPGEAYISEIEEAVERLDEAVEEAEEVLERGIPLMSTTVRGGAKLGQGLKVDSGALSLGNLVESGTGAEVTTHGCAIYSVDGEGWATQDGTPTPDSPVEIEVARGRNLFDSPVNKKSIGNPSQGISIGDNGTTYISKIAKNTDYSVSSFKGGNRFRVVLFKQEPSATASMNVSELRGTTETTTPMSFTFNSGDYEWVALTLHNSTYDTTLLAQLELGSTPTPYVPYGHVGIDLQPGEISDSSKWVNGSGNNVTGDLSTGSPNRIRSGKFEVTPDTDYCVSFDSSTFRVSVYLYDADGAFNARLSQWQNQPFTFNSLTAVNAAIIASYKNDAALTPSTLALIGLKFATTTPIPLPAKGFAASLPDGTADALTLDSAGRYEWTSSIKERTFDGDENWAASTSNGFTISPANSGLTDCKRAPTNLTSTLSNQYSNANTTWTNERFGIDNNYLWVGDSNFARFSDVNGFKAWLANIPLTILYPLATPTTEHGYIDLPALPSGATVSCPELEQIGVSWFVDGCEPIVEHISNERRRTEEALADVYEAIADL